MDDVGLTINKCQQSIILLETQFDPEQCQEASACMTEKYTAEKWKDITSINRRPKEASRFNPSSQGLLILMRILPSY